MSIHAPLIVAECDELKAMLLEKDRAYGSSALSPVRVFSKADRIEQLRVRLDDKLSRLMRGDAAGEDVVLDLLGYLVLLRVAQRLQCMDRERERIEKLSASTPAPAPIPFKQCDVEHVAGDGRCMRELGHTNAHCFSKGPEHRLVPRAEPSSPVTVLERP